MKTPQPSPARPLPQEVLRRLVGTEARSAAEALQGVAVEPTEIEDFRPLGDSLEWRLADAFWDGAGAIPFVRNDVPYLVNNNGRLSANAAALVWAALHEARATLPERIVMLELGAGVGLFARYFLDVFAAECRKENSDLYERLTFVVTDRFEKTVRGWQRDGIFAGHEAHVALCVCDASSPGKLALPGGAPPPPLPAPVVVFCNYLLDVLPASIARRTDAGLEQLCVRTHLAGGASTLAGAGLGSLDEARALAASGRFEDLVRLLPLLPSIELETAFRPWTPSTAAETELAAAVSASDRAIVNSGALACLERILAGLAPCGLVLINDYGPVRPEDVGSHLGVQRFGGSVALGVNFPLLESALARRGFATAAPAGDDQRRVHTRLVARRIGPRSLEILHQRFGLETDRQLDAPQEEARAHLAAGRRNEALAAYHRMVERNPGDWQMLGEAAEYVGLQLGDHAAGLDLATSALERNPWSSAWLWNVLGDCLFYRQRLDDAHAAFLQAQRIDPDDPRTNLNLAYTLSARGDQTAALGAIARGLAHDSRGHYRPRLLEKQAQVLALLSERAAAEQNRLVRRAERFRL
ncbi:MAG: tetratricopeptide repeat protein [Deltaproteobacteria bacterium]|nr:tetratricopeptide repeat protein [Deltaproteobacteria bacterium]